MNTQLLSNWKFQYNDCPEAWYKGYDDSSWEGVTVPHDWSVHMPFSKEYSSGTGYLAGGIGWYRGSFYLPEELKGKKIFITFDGVYKNSQVWCNSYYLGKRPFGYATFRYDITEQAVFGDTPNVMAVRVDHKDISDSRWFTGSGITRKVTVTAEEPVYAEYNSIFFTTPEVSKEEASVKITSTIINEAAEATEVTVKHTLGFQAKEALTVTSSLRLSPNEKKEITVEGLLSSPMLWSVNEPNLYKLTTEIKAQSITGTSSTQQNYESMVGIRSFRFTPDNGFYLNDEPLKLKGVCVHHDAGCLGAAVLPSVWLRRLEALKEMGCNSIRMSHNPHMPELYDLCDALGFLVMDEAFDEWESPKNKWWTGHNVYPPRHQGYAEDFPQWHEQDLTDLIKRDRNHPSIIMWSIGNEIDYPNDPYCHPLFTTMTGNNDKDKPSAEREYNPNKPNAERLSVIAANLTRIVKASDTTRPVTAAVAFPELSTFLGYIDSFDVVGYNYKEEWYERDHGRFPEKPFLGSENSHSLSAWKAVRDCDYISGQYLWTGIDYLGEAHGWPVRGSYAGLLTTAGFKKTSFYRRKSFWQSEPTVYLTTARAAETEKEAATEWEWKEMFRSYNYIPEEKVEIRCYTNLSGIELFVNGKSQGRKAYDDNLGYIPFTITFEAGELKAVGYSTDNETEEMAADVLLTNGAPCDISLTSWEPSAEILAFNKAYIEDILTFDGLILKQIEVTLLDGNGLPCLTDSSLLRVSLEGGKILGLENGNLADVREYTALERRAYNGKLLIYAALSEDNKGVLTVKGSSLKTRSITL